MKRVAFESGGSQGTEFVELMVAGTAVEPGASPVFLAADACERLGGDELSKGVLWVTGEEDLRFPSWIGRGWVFGRRVLASDQCC